MAATPHRQDIGDYRKIRLNHEPNKGGYWEVWWTDHAAGSLTKKQSTKTKIRSEAEDYLRAFCDDVRQAQTVVAAPTTPTVGELSAKWLAYSIGAGKTARGVSSMLAAIGRELGQYTADYLATPAGTVLLGEYVQKRGRSNGTIRRELGALQSVLKWAARPGVGLIKPADVPSFDGLKPPPGAPRTRFLDHAQEQWFWDQAMGWGHRDHGSKLKNDGARRVMVFVALGLATSARYEAIMELTWDRVNLTLGFVDYQVPGRRVTKKRRARMPISDRLMPVLKEAWLRAPKDGSGQATGTVLEGTRYLGQSYRRFTQAIGMAWVTPHVLRHTWASLAAMNGVPLIDIGRIMGDTTATVESVYVHLTPEHLRSAVNHHAGRGTAAARTA